MSDKKIQDYLKESVLEFKIGSAKVKVSSFGKEETGNDFFGRTFAKNYFEIHYVCDGNGVLIVGDEKHILKKGILYVIGSEKLYHHFSSEGKLNEYYMSIHIENTDSKLYRILSSNRFFCCENADDCEVCFKSAEREVKERRHFYVESTVNHFKQLIIFLARQYEYADIESHLPRAAKEDKYCLITDEEFIFNLQGLTLKRLSEKLGLSQRQCQRFLMENYGMSYSEKLLQSRMIKAADYLAFTDKDIQEIVEKVGYSESSYFTRIFKKNFGMTPRAYRKYSSEKL